MQASPRCGARTRAGTPCRSPAVAGKNRCRMHGGAKGSGAPKGNNNALKHGFYSKAALCERRAVQALIRAAEGVLRED
jgi:glucans biosynthesis protein